MRSPSGVPPGCRVTTTSRPLPRSASASNRTWVDLPAPSPPSKHTNRPGAVSTRRVAAARFSVTLPSLCDPTVTPTPRADAPSLTTPSPRNTPSRSQPTGIGSRWVVTFSVCCRAWCLVPCASWGLGAGGSAAGEGLLGDLDGGEGRALAQVVADDEEHEPLALGGGLVGAHPTDEDLVPAGRLERVGHVGDHDTGRLAQQLQRLVRRDVALELRVDGKAVSGEDRHAHA